MQAKAETQAFSQATSGESLAVKLATGKVKADFSSDNSRSSVNGGVKKGMPTAGPAPWGEGKQPQPAH